MTSHFLRHYNFTFTDALSYLMINDLQPHDEGQYSCFASNGIEAVTADTSVTVSVGGCDFESDTLCGWIQVQL